MAQEPHLQLCRSLVCLTTLLVRGRCGRLRRGPHGRGQHGGRMPSVPRKSVLRSPSASRWVQGACRAASERSTGALSQHGSQRCPFHQVGDPAHGSPTSRLLPEFVTVHHLAQAAAHPCRLAVLPAFTLSRYILPAPSTLLIPVCLRVKVSQSACPPRLAVHPFFRGQLHCLCSGDLWGHSKLQILMQ